MDPWHQPIVPAVQVLNDKEFCIGQTEEQVLAVRACLPHANETATASETKMYVYPWIILLSILCLALTLAIYLIVPALISHYTKEEYRNII